MQKLCNEMKPKFSLQNLSRSEGVFTALHFLRNLCIDPIS